MTIAQTYLFSTVALSADNHAGLLGSHIIAARLVKHIDFHVRENDAWVRKVCASEGIDSVLSIKLHLFGAELSSTTRLALQEAFPFLEKLEFDVYAVWDLRALSKDVRMMCAFEHLKAIVLRGSYGSAYSLDRSLAIPRSVRSIKLDMPSSALTRVLTWLVGQQPTDVQVFQVQNVGDQAVCMVLDLVVLWAQSLRELHIGMYSQSADICQAVRSHWNKNDILVPTLEILSVDVDGNPDVGMCVLEETVHRCPALHAVGLQVWEGRRTCAPHKVKETMP
ncbi:hypothetical protein CYLTODRAFT_417954 [Cylindrobasidium torrendii FP15055 ss-10]|uniref:F-box domain-containing protein n=1 Tax=Cylindrobasidium torrendii FP15055 ss-10 TaxID=1314674 RepID=A0A0D7BQ66_9AGAR|nr:hypothetical protein CYLTODRAFT_417954 [Cylindrobasidium torrendii FP15055 ss-10]